MRWVEGAKEGEVLLGEKGEGSKNNQLDRSAGVTLDKQGNLYVVDRDNHRIVCFRVGAHQSGGVSRSWKCWHRQETQN